MNAMHAARRITPDRISMTKEFPMIFSAFFVFPAPLAMEQRGAPPMPNRLANAVMIVMMGSDRPIPVSASEEVWGI